MFKSRLVWLLSGIAVAVGMVALAQVPISGLPNAGTQTGSEYIPEVQSGSTVKVTSGVLAAFAATAANPAGEVCSTVVNGVATTFMRSDAAPALNEACNYSLTGIWLFGQGVELANNTAVQGLTTGATLYNVLTPYDAANATDLYNLDAQPINLGVSAVAGGSPVKGLTIVAVNTTYSQAEVYDSGGNAWPVGYRDVPEETSNCSSGTCTLELLELGKWVVVSTGGGTITWPASTFSDGATITLRVCCGSATTVTVGSGLTLIWANGTEATGNRTVTDGQITLHQEGTSNVFISGTGIS